MSSTTSSSTPKRTDLVRSASPVTDSVSATALRTHRAGELTRAHVGKHVRLGGWVHRRRDLGGLVFIDLRDRAGLVQLSCNPRLDPAGGDGARRRRGAETVVLVTGTVALRPEPSRDPALGSREVEVHVDRSRDRRGPRRRRRFRWRGRRRRSWRPRSSGSGTACSTCAGPSCSRTSSCATGCCSARAARSASWSSSRSRRRSSPSPRPRAPATIWCPAGSTRASSTRCRSRRRSTSSCSWWRATTGTSRSPAASGTRTCGPTASRSSPRSTSRPRS